MKHVTVLYIMSPSSDPCQMSDVEVGGSTVFPDIGAALRPYKVQSKLTNHHHHSWLYG